MSTVKLEMNGYRDPEAQEAARQAYIRELEAGGMDFARFAAGAAPGSGARACGYRKEGGTYAEVPRSPYGKPVEHFIACPPVPIDADEYGLTAVGVKLIDWPEPCLTCGGGGEMQSKEGGLWHPVVCRSCNGLGLVPVTHVFDIVGGEYYPNVADFIEEARRMGISRRLELSGGAPTPCAPCNGSGSRKEPETGQLLGACPECKGEGMIPGANQYARLTSRSRLILLHKRAVIHNAADFNVDLVLHSRPDEDGRVLEVERLMRAGCPKSNTKHKIERADPEPGYLTPHASPACSALWWHDIEGGEYVPERQPSPCKACGGKGDTVTRLILKTDVLDLEGGCKACGGSGLDQSLEDAGRFVERKLACGSYRGYSRPESFTPNYGLGIIGVFPLVKLTVIDPEGIYQDRVDRAQAAGVPVDIEEC